MEEWKDIPGHDGKYQASSRGRVRSRSDYQGGSKGPIRILKESCSHRYRRVFLRRNGKTDTVYVHRAVAMAFLPNPGGMPEVNHRDGDRSNNSVSNLEWCTSTDNKMHAARTGLMPSGESHSSAKLTDEDVKAIRDMYSTGKYTYEELAGKFGVVFGHIGQIVRGEARKSQTQQA